MFSWGDWLLILCEAAAMVLAARILLHYFQLESYQFRGYFKTVLRQWKRAFLPGVLLTVGLLASLFLGLLVFFILWLIIPWTVAEAVTPVVILAVQLTLGIVLHRHACKTPQKKKFALTARMKRLYAVLAVVCLAVCALNAYGCKYFDKLYHIHEMNEAGKAYLSLSNAFGFIRPSLFLPLWVALAGVIAWPIERLIFHLYFRDAEKKLLENPKLIRIGITGSYGKTSTKFILAEILSQKYNVLATPASFNTPMGVTRIIRERLTAAHQVFIGEMGARHVGEIRELSRLVHPQIGILTAVGPQHLDTFKTIERIEKTKYELIEALPEDGLAVFLSDDAIVTRLYEQTNKPKMLAGRENADVWAENIEVGPWGSRFTLRFRDGASIPCETVLLGEHNIRNILSAAAVAKYLGLTPEQIKRGIQALKPVEHRLQLMKTQGGVTVIDDAFNTNPRSSQEALKVLSSFPGRRVIVTPGMVELGTEEERYNREFGQAMADSVDVAVLVGKKHTAPIREGLKEKGFPEDSIHTVASLDEAIAAVGGLLRPGDVVMYENDLPDHYSET